LLLTGYIYTQARERWSVPLGPGLELATYTPTRLSTATKESPTELPATPTKIGDPTATETLPPTATLVPTATPEPLCGGPAVMYILGIGADADADYLYGLADAIRIARIDFVTPKITVISIPRDLWVEIPEISDHYDITHGKLNQAYFYGSPGMGYYDGPGGAPGLLARTIDLNFGVRVDHYGAVNMSTFVKIVDAVGGIDIYLPTDVDGRPIDDKTEDMGYFEAGQQHFNGDQALRFSRIRKKYSDFKRLDNQDMVICALREKILTPAVLPKIPQIVSAFQDSVQTDLSLEQIGQLACLLPKIKQENIILGSIPEEILSPSRIYSEEMKDNTYILDVDNQVIRDYFTRFMDGTYPDQPAEPSCP
jgi:LCP family protein required for cell wall assembly